VRVETQGKTKSVMVLFEPRSAAPPGSRMTPVGRTAYRTDRTVTLIAVGFTALFVTGDQANGGRGSCGIQAQFIRQVRPTPPDASTVMR